MITDTQKRILGAVGLASKARKCITGTELCVEYMRADKGNLLIVAEDISENTRKKLLKTASFHKIPYITVDLMKSDLAGAAGKKSDAASILFTDKGFVKIIENLGIEIHITDTEVLE